jgi:hypothetical protein
VAMAASDCGGASSQGVAGRFPVLFEGQLGVLTRLDLERACTRFQKEAFADLSASSGGPRPQRIGAAQLTRAPQRSCTRAPPFGFVLSFRVTGLRSTSRCLEL